MPAFTVITLAEPLIEQAELLSEGSATACGASHRPHGATHLRISPSSRPFTSGHSLSITL